jgi:hypothetical protein
MDNNDPLGMLAASAHLKQTEEALNREKEKLQTQITELRKENDELKHPILGEDTTTNELQQLPNESEDCFQKRRQRIYNKRAYQKRLDRQRVQRLDLETTCPTSVASIPADNPFDKSLGKVISAIRKEHPEKWTSVFRKNGDVRLVTTLYYLNESHPGIMVEKSTRVPEKIRPVTELKREYVIQFKDAFSQEWCDLFVIKPSSLRKTEGLRPKAGMGLFAARPFRAYDTIGMYLGEVFEASLLPRSRRTVYSLAFNEENVHPLSKKRAKSVESKMYIIDAGIGPDTTSSYYDIFKRAPVFFGIHYANDPLWTPSGVQGKRSRSTPDYNVEVMADLTVQTLSNIEVGEELFMDYTGGTGKMI